MVQVLASFVSQLLQQLCVVIILFVHVGSVVVLVCVYIQYMKLYMYNNKVCHCEHTLALWSMVAYG